MSEFVVENWHKCQRNLKNPNLIKALGIGIFNSIEYPKSGLCQDIHSCPAAFTTRLNYDYIEDCLRQSPDLDEKYQ